MVTSGGSVRIEGGNQILSAGVRKTIQTIKEIVGNHTDADIYVALKDSNMDPNETAQKLLNQDPFHEVKRRRDKKKELQSVGYKFSADPRKSSANFIPMTKVQTFTDRNGRRGGYTRNALPAAGINREFRVVRDNRVNQNTIKEMTSLLPQCSTSTDENVVLNAAEKGSPAGIPSCQKPSGGWNLSQVSNGPTNPQNRPTRDSNHSDTDRREASDVQEPFPGAGSHVQVVKANNSQEQSVTLASSNSLGAYFSSTDPVHVPSPDSRSSAAVGAIKREVGVVGGGRQSSENAAKDASATNGSFSNSLLGRDNSSESFQPFPAISKADQLNQNVASGSGMPSIPVSRALFTNHYTGKSHQQAIGHQKASQHNKEWKPKSSQKSSVIGPGVIGTPTKSTAVPADNSKELESDVAKLRDKLSRVDIYENQNVIIAQHIRVPETDRCRLTFGSLGMDFDSSRPFSSGFQSVGAAEESNSESAASLSVAAPKSSGDDVSDNKPVDIVDDLVRNSGSDSTASGEASEHQLPDDIKEASSPQNLDNYGDIGLARENNQTYTLSESQQQQDPSEMATFLAYDPQTGYDMPYFRPGVGETVRGQGLPSPQESLASHATNSIPASTIAMVQQQQPPQMTQMYPPVHVSHFTNLMPYRQFISPLYVPQMAMPGYSSNPAYPHPPNGSSYLLMPGGSSHLSTNGLKYGIQQFKPVPVGSPTGFGNFTNPTGYAINGPNVVGSATGLEDSSRMKYKDGNLYVSNPQAETSPQVFDSSPRTKPKSLKNSGNIMAEVNQSFVEQDGNHEGDPIPENPVPEEQVPEYEVPEYHQVPNDEVPEYQIPNDEVPEYQISNDEVPEEQVTEDSQPQQKLEHEEDSAAGGGEKKWPGWPGESVFRMLVPAQKVGSIIGRKGEFIKKIVEETRARIKILDGPPGTTERAVMISAKEEPDSSLPPAMDGLLRVHKRIVDGLEGDSSHPPQGGKVSTRLLVPASQAGSLIGKQGGTVKSIQEASSCIVRVLGAEDLPVFALQDDRVVEVVGDATGVHKAIELIASHLRKFLVDRSIIPLFEMHMQMANPQMEHMPPHQSWGPPQGLPPNASGGPGFGTNPQYMPPPRQVDNYYPPADLPPPIEKQPHQGISAYGREAPMGVHGSSSAQSAPSMITQITQQMQIPLSYADAVIGTAGASISYIRRSSGATVTIQETRGVPGEMTVEISGTASQVQTAQQLIQNFMAEAAASSQAQIGGSTDQGYNPYATHSSMYGSPPSNPGHTSHTGGYGSVYGSNYGY